MDKSDAKRLRTIHSRTEDACRSLAQSTRDADTSKVVTALDLILQSVADQANRALRDPDSHQEMVRELLLILRHVTTHLHLRSTSLLAAREFPYWDYMSALLSYMLDLKLAARLASPTLELCYHTIPCKHRVWDVVVQSTAIATDTLADRMPAVIDKLVAWCPKTFSDPAQFFKFLTAVVAVMKRCDEGDSESLKRVVLAVEPRFDFPAWFSDQGFDLGVPASKLTSRKKLLNYLCKSAVTGPQLLEMCRALVDPASSTRRRPTPAVADERDENDEMFAIAAQPGTTQAAVDTNGEIELALEKALTRMRAGPGGGNADTTDCMIDSEIISDSSNQAVDPETFLQTFLNPVYDRSNDGEKSASTDKKHVRKKRRRLESPSSKKSHDSETPSEADEGNPGNAGSPARSLRPRKSPTKSPSVRDRGAAEDHSRERRLSRLSNVGEGVAPSPEKTCGQPSSPDNSETMTRSRRRKGSPMKVPYCETRGVSSPSFEQDDVSSKKQRSTSAEPGNPQQKRAREKTSQATDHRERSPTKLPSAKSSAALLTEEVARETCNISMDADNAEVVSPSKKSRRIRKFSLSVEEVEETPILNNRSDHCSPRRKSPTKVSFNANCMASSSSKNKSKELSLNDSSSRGPEAFSRSKKSPPTISDDESEDQLNHSRKTAHSLSEKKPPTKSRPKQGLSTSMSDDGIEVSNLYDDAEVTGRQTKSPRRKSRNLVELMTSDEEADGVAAQNEQRPKAFSRSKKSPPTISDDRSEDQLNQSKKAAHSSSKRKPGKKSRSKQGLSTSMSDEGSNLSLSDDAEVTGRRIKSSTRKSRNPVELVTSDEEADDVAARNEQSPKAFSRSKKSPPTISDDGFEDELNQSKKAGHSSSERKSAIKPRSKQVLRTSTSDKGIEGSDLSDGAEVTGRRTKSPRRKSRNPVELVTSDEEGNDVAAQNEQSPKAFSRSKKSPPTISDDESRDQFNQGKRATHSSSERKPPTKSRSKQVLSTSTSDQGIEGSNLSNDAEVTGRRTKSPKRKSRNPVELVTSDEEGDSAAVQNEQRRRSSTMSSCSTTCIVSSSEEEEPRALPKVAGNQRVQGSPFKRPLGSKSAVPRHESVPPQDEGHQRNRTAAQELQGQKKSPGKYCATLDNSSLKGPEEEQTQKDSSSSDDGRCAEVISVDSDSDDSTNVETESMPSSDESQHSNQASSANKTGKTSKEPELPIPVPKRTGTSHSESSVALVGSLKLPEVITENSDVSSRETTEGSESDNERDNSKALSFENILSRKAGRNKELLVTPAASKTGIQAANNEVASAVDNTASKVSKKSVDTIVVPDSQECASPSRNASSESSSAGSENSFNSSHSDVVIPETQDSGTAQSETAQLASATTQKLPLQASADESTPPSQESDCLDGLTQKPSFARRGSSDESSRDEGLLTEDLKKTSTPAVQKTPDRKSSQSPRLRPRSSRQSAIRARSKLITSPEKDHESSPEKQPGSLRRILMSDDDSDTDPDFNLGKKGVMGSKTGTPKLELTRVEESLLQSAGRKTVNEVKGSLGSRKPSKLSLSQKQSSQAVSNETTDPVQDTNTPKRKITSPSAVKKRLGNAGAVTQPPTTEPQPVESLPSSAPRRGVANIEGAESNSENDFDIASAGKACQSSATVQSESSLRKMPPRPTRVRKSTNTILQGSQKDSPANSANRRTEGAGCSSGSQLSPTRVADMSQASTQPMEASSSKAQLDISAIIDSLVSDNEEAVSQTPGPSGSRGESCCHCSGPKRETRTSEIGTMTDVSYSEGTSTSQVSAGSRGRRRNSTTQSKSRTSRGKRCSQRPETNAATPPRTVTERRPVTSHYNLRMSLSVPRRLKY